MPTNVALIGCGQHAREMILPCLLLTPGAHLRYACDPDQQLARAAAAYVPGAQAITDYRAALDGPERVDAVLVVAPPQVHSEVAAAALERGVHVFTEKPPAVTTAEL